MPHRYLDDIAIADVAFEAWDDSLEGMFAAAAAATLQVMVADLASVAGRERRELRLEAEAIDLLLFQLLEELIFYKDAERLLLRVANIHIKRHDDTWVLTAQLQGELIDPDRHELLVDVKAVTLHRFHVGRSEDGWKAFVILDI